MSRRLAPAIKLSCGLALALVAGSSALADMSLTPAGVARGFTLTTFATGFPNSGGVGPAPIDFQTDGSILIGNNPDNHIYRFTNTDNQTVAGTPVLNYPTSEFPHGIAHFGTTVYVSRYNSQSIVQLNPDGSINHTVTSGLGNARELLADNTTGRLITSTVQGIRFVDPVSGSVTNFNSEESDGISLSADGTILYGAIISGARTGHLIGYNTLTGATVFDSGFIGGGLDGTALGFGLNSGYIYGNLNNGTVIEINLTTLSTVVIATGGSRGDFVSADPSGSGDLLLTQTDRVLRLSGIPSPSAAALLGMGMLGALRRRR